MSSHVYKKLDISMNGKIVFRVFNVTQYLIIYQRVGYTSWSYCTETSIPD